MSLREKWNEYRLKEVQEIDRKANVTSFWEGALSAAFYAGAEAYRREYWETTATSLDLREEIKHFESRPK